MTTLASISHRPPSANPPAVSPFIAHHQPFLPYFASPFTTVVACIVALGEVTSRLIFVQHVKKRGQLVLVQALKEVVMMKR